MSEQAIVPPKSTRTTPADIIKLSATEPSSSPKAGGTEQGRGHNTLCNACGVCAQACSI